MCVNVCMGVGGEDLRPVTKNHLITRKQNVACLACDPSSARTHSVHNHSATDAAVAAEFDVWVEISARHRKVRCSCL